MARIRAYGGLVSGFNGHGSLTNAFAGTPADVVPKPGMGITIIMWTDRHAGTITRVSPSGKTFWYREDRATRIDGNGMSESQEYTFETVTEGPERCARRCKDGQWRDCGTKIVLGYRSEYRDFSF